MLSLSIIEKQVIETFKLRPTGGGCYGYAGGTALGSLFMPRTYWGQNAETLS